MRLKRLKCTAKGEDIFRNFLWSWMGVIALLRSYLLMYLKIHPGFCPKDLISQHPKKGKKE
ncbi:MAG: hypothetical protein ACRCYP_04425, partial [Alphaproteobacteria bacterium]